MPNSDQIQSLVRRLERLLHTWPHHLLNEPLYYSNKKGMTLRGYNASKSSYL